MNIDYSFLADRDNDVYSNRILKLSIDSTKKCLELNEKLIEIEFPVNRNSRTN